MEKLVTKEAPVEVPVDKIVLQVSCEGSFVTSSRVAWRLPGGHSKDRSSVNCRKANL